MLRLLAVLVLCAGCRLGFDEHSGSSPVDATLDDDGAADASDGDVITIDAMPSACGVGYTSWAALASTYRVVTNAAPWLTAETTCEADGAHLIVVGSAAEHAAVVANTGTAQWIGASDRITEGSFLVVTGGGEPYSNWAGTPPANVGEDCVQILTNASWEDAECLTDFVYVCECDGVAVSPVSF